MSSDHDFEAILEDLDEKASSRSDGDWPMAWNPEEPGETLIGEVISFETDIPLTDYDQVADVATIETPDGKFFSLWLNRKVLAEKWNQENPSIGDGVGIKYHGLKDRENGHDYHDYSVTSDGSSDDNQDESDKSSKKREKQDGIPF